MGPQREPKALVYLHLRPREGRKPEHAFARDQSGTNLHILYSTRIQKELPGKDEGPSMPPLGTIQYVLQQTGGKTTLLGEGQSRSMPSFMTTPHLSQCTGLTRRFAREGLVSSDSGGQTPEYASTSQESGIHLQILPGRGNEKTGPRHARAEDLDMPSLTGHRLRSPAMYRANPTEGRRAKHVFTIDNLINPRMCRTPEKASMRGLKAPECVHLRKCHTSCDEEVSRGSFHGRAMIWALARAEVPSRPLLRTVPHPV